MSSTLNHADVLRPMGRLMTNACTAQTLWSEGYLDADFSTICDGVPVVERNLCHVPGVIPHLNATRTMDGTFLVKLSVYVKACHCSVTYTHTDTYIQTYTTDTGTTF